MIMSRLVLDESESIEISRTYPAMSILSMTVAPTAIPANSPTCIQPNHVICQTPTTLITCLKDSVLLTSTNHFSVSSIYIYNDQQTMFPTLLYNSIDNHMIVFEENPSWAD